MSKEEKRIYKKRIIVGNTFSWIFKNRRIINTYDKKKITYMGFLFMAFTKILLKRM